MARSKFTGIQMNAQSLSSNGWTGRDYGTMIVWKIKQAMPSSAITTTSRYIGSSITMPNTLAISNFTITSAWVGDYGGHLIVSLQGSQAGTAFTPCVGSCYTAGSLTAAGSIEVTAIQFV